MQLCRKSFFGIGIATLCGRENLLLLMTITCYNYNNYNYLVLSLGLLLLLHKKDYLFMCRRFIKIMMLSKSMISKSITRLII